MKTIVVIIVYDRLENLRRWLRCWDKCDKEDAELMVIHNFDNPEDQVPYRALCADHGIRYEPRINAGYDIGAFKDFCQGRYPADYENLLWITDDNIPMARDFVKQFASKMTGGTGVACYEMSSIKSPFHVRTTGFCIRKKVLSRLVFGDIVSKRDCYVFEHRGQATLMLQVKKMGLRCVQVSGLGTSPLWDIGHRAHLNRWAEHNKIFPNTDIDIPDKPLTMTPITRIDKICIASVFDRNYKEAGRVLFNSIRRHTDCASIDFKVITADPEVLKELGAENCHFVTDEIKARYAGVKYSADLPVEKYASSWYRYEIFSMTEYDRVICIDSDCICVEDISYLFSQELNAYDLVSVEDHIVSKCFMAHVPQLQRDGLRFENLVKRMKEGKIDIQPALLVANKSIVNREWYEKLLNYANTAPFSYSIDEGVLNDFIYTEELKIKLLPLEWDYQDCYEIHCKTLRVPSKPIIVHCQESKPFKKTKQQTDRRLHKWHDLWHQEAKEIQAKTIVAIIVWNRFESLKRWVNCWRRCQKEGAQMVVVHNLEQDNARYAQLCSDNGVIYVPRENKGFDIGAFQDVCRERLEGFPNKWDNLIWITDDCIPMATDFVGRFLSKLSEGYLPCYEISDEVKRHIRTTGFLVTKEISKKLIFPQDPIESRTDCYMFEHNSHEAFYEQVVKMGHKPVMVNEDLKLSSLWDSGARGFLNLMDKHEQVFPPIKTPVSYTPLNSVLDELAIRHKSDKSSRFHNYTVKYDKILAPYRESYTSVLEIGVAQGQSVRMWTDYFPNATIHGADISKASETCQAYSERIRFHLLDQSKEAELKNMEQFSPFDLVIDDGNHWWKEQILTFKTLFPYVRPGGIYIVEDTTTSYWGEYRNHPISAVEFFKTLADEVHLKGARGSIPVNPPAEFGDWDKGWHRREDCFKVLPLFDSVQFMNGFIVITKR